MIERIKSAMVGAGAGWVLWLMLVLSVVSLAIMLERAWLFWSLRDDTTTLMRELGRLCEHCLSPEFREFPPQKVQKRIRKIPLCPGVPYAIEYSFNMMSCSIGNAGAPAYLSGTPQMQGVSIRFLLDFTSDRKSTRLQTPACC